MPQRNHSRPSNERNIVLAIHAIQNGQFQSVRAAAKAFSVSHATLARRVHSLQSRRDCVPNSQKLDSTEESVLVQHVLDLDARGLPPRLRIVEDMANKLLATRSSGKVGIRWASNFVKRTPQLQTRLNRKYDYQRAKCESPELITQWFNLVKNTIAKYGILESDLYNFDETGFQMGVISTGLMVTAAERRARPKSIRPGNREWATVMQGISANGWALPPFIIFKGQHHLEHGIAMTYLKTGL